jgi:phosphoglucosamine mutase
MLCNRCTALWLAETGGFNMKQGKLFGTDGIRGVANTAPMTAEIALKVGTAVGSLFIRGEHRHLVVIGKDTRLSGYMIEPALTAGFVSAGMDVVLVGPMPTPAVAMLTRSLRADVGVMISASHNPYQDNGIKLFDHQGFKLSDKMEAKIEAQVKNDVVGMLAKPESLGRARRLDDARGRYMEYVKNTFPKGKTLTGLRIVVDCANGAAYHLGPSIFWELGAEVIPMGVSPNGFNINQECGAVAPKSLAAAVVEHQAHIGIALDGDADRLVVCDEKGKIIDGDQIIALIAKHQKKIGALQGDAIITTHMSNMGLEKYLAEQKLKMLRADVGDRYVAEMMRQKGCNIGGEQSGHIILQDYSTTGDGLVAALQVLAVLVAAKAPASEVCNLFAPFPQRLENIPYSSSNPLAHEKIQQAIADAESALAKRGRLLVRSSGTEPLVRVMIEADKAALVSSTMKKLVSVIQSCV